MDTRSNPFLRESGVIECCEKCNGKMKYTGVGEYVCQKCSHVMYNEYGKVRKYIETHPGANQVEISEATGVEKKKIIQLLREEKLQISESSLPFLTCEKCGTPIRSGMYCTKCMALALKNPYDADKRTGHIKGGYTKPSSEGGGARRFKFDR